MSKHCDLLVGERALHAVRVVTQVFILLLIVIVVLLGRFRFDTMNVLFGRRRVREVFRMKILEVVLLNQLCTVRLGRKTYERDRRYLQSHVNS